MPAQVFAILDAARMGEALATALALAPTCDSLYRGPRAPLLAPVAPHLAEFPVGSVLSEWFFAAGWGQAWGVFCYSEAPYPALHQHLRRFLTVGLEDGRPFYLRYYDPRVLRRLLPTCSPAQLETFFGPIDYFWLEDEDPDFGLYYWLDAPHGHLLTHRVSRAELHTAFD